MKEEEEATKKIQENYRQKQINKAKRENAAELDKKREENIKKK